MKLSDYIVLIHKRLRGELDPNEANKLDHWLSQQPDARLSEDMGKVWQLSARYKQEYEPDVQQGLTRLKSHLKQEQKAARPQPRLKARRSWFAAAAALALLVVAGLWWLVQGSSDTYAFSTGAGEARELRLPDGSLVQLNESSVLTYLSAADATAGERVVRLSGEAFFSVQKDANRPFIVETEATRTTVLGTSFNVRAYPQEPTEEVEVAEGRVRLEQKQGKEALELEPMERGVCQTKAGELYKLEVRHTNAQAWYTHELEFRKERLAPALREIERYYSVQFRLSNPKLKDCLYNAKLEGVTLEDFIRSLEAIFGLKVRQLQPGVYVLEGGRCR